MKQLFFGLATVLSCMSALGQSPPAVPRTDGFRLVAGQPQPPAQEGMRQLSVQQRAELRRQVVEFSKTSGKRL